MTPSPRQLVVCLLLAAASFAPRTALADAASDQFSVAAAHYSQRRWQLAADEFAAFLREWPLHAKAANARFFRGEALLQRREYEEARREFRRYVEHFGKDQFARQAKYRIAEIGYLLEDHDQARDDLRAFLRDYPDDNLNAQVLTYLGQLALDTNEPDAAGKYFDQALTKFPDSPLAPEMQFGLARAWERAGDTPRALAAFREQASAAEPAAEVLFHLGACEYAEGNYEAALAALDRLNREFPQHAFAERVGLLRGWSLYQGERYDEARQAFAPLVENERLGAEAGYWLGLAQKKLNDYPAAAKTLTASARRHPDSPWTPAMQFHAGDALLLANRVDEAAEQFKAVRKSKDPNWTDDALLGLARVALAQGAYDRVVELADEYAQEFPTGSLATQFARARATALINAGQPEPAIVVLEELRAADESNPVDARLLAQAYQRAGRFHEALDLLDSTSDDTHSEVNLIRGLSLVGLERHADALVPLERYFAAEPKSNSAPLALAEICYCQLRVGEALSARRSFETLQGEYSKSEIFIPAVRRLADLAFKSEEFEFAKLLHQRLVEQESDAAAAAQGLFGLARISFRDADYADADDRLAELIERYPNSELLAEARLLRGGALEKTGDFDSAQGLYREVFTAHADTPLAARAMLAAARLHRRAKQHAEADKLYRKLLAREDSVVARDMALYELAWLLRDDGDPQAANEFFQQIHDEHLAGEYWADATYRLAEQARSRGERDQAAKYLDELIANPEQRQMREFALYLRGQIAAEQKRWAEVKSPMQSLLDEHPESRLAAQAEFWLAEALYRQNDYDAAAERFERIAATAETGDHDWLPLVTLRRAQILAQKENWESAQSLAASIRARHPNFAQQYEVDYLLGRCYANNARFDDAREAYRRATRSETGSKSETAAMAQWMIGESYFHQKDYRAAIQEYLRVEILYAYPTWQAAALLQAGKCHELLGETAEALELYARLMKRYPDTQFSEEAARRLALAQKQEPKRS